MLSAAVDMSCSVASPSGSIVSSPCARVASEFVVFVPAPPAVLTGPAFTLTSPFVSAEDFVCFVDL